MKILLDEKNAVIACVFVGNPILSGSETAVEVENIPEEVRNANSRRYVYKDGEYSLNPDYAEPEPELSLEEKVAQQAKTIAQQAEIIAQQQEQLTILTECMLEVSEYVYQ